MQLWIFWDNKYFPTSILARKKGIIFFILCVNKYSCQALYAFHTNSFYLSNIFLRRTQQFFSNPSLSFEYLHNVYCFLGKMVRCKTLLVSKKSIKATEKRQKGITKMKKSVSNANKIGNQKERLLFIEAWFGAIIWFYFLFIM